MSTKAKKSGLVALCGVMSLYSLDGCSTIQNYAKGKHTSNIRRKETDKSINYIKILTNAGLINEPVKINKFYFDAAINQYNSNSY